MIRQQAPDHPYYDLHKGTIFRISYPYPIYKFFFYKTKLQLYYRRPQVMTGSDCLDVNFLRRFIFENTWYYFDFVNHPCVNHVPQTYKKNKLGLKKLYTPSYAYGNLKDYSVTLVFPKPVTLTRRQLQYGSKTPTIEVLSIKDVQTLYPLKSSRIVPTPYRKSRFQFFYERDFRSLIVYY